MGLNAPRKFSRKKLLIIFAVVFFVLLGLGAGGFRWWSCREFNQFVQKVENLSQQDMASLLALDQLEREAKEEFDAIVFETTANPTVNKKHLTRTEELHDEINGKIQDEYLPLVEEQISDINQFLDRRGRLWLWGDEKGFLDLMASVSEAAARATAADGKILEADALLSPISFALQSDTIEYLKFIKTYGGVTPSSAMLKALAPFKRYSTGYKFPGEAQLKTLYPSFYKALTNYKALYGKVYEMFAAYVGGNYSRAIQLSEEANEISKRSFDMTVDWDPLNRPFLQGELDAHARALQAVNLYRESKLGKISLGGRRLAAASIMWAAQLYALDHNDKYPTASTVTAAVGLLADGGYLSGDFVFDQATFAVKMGKKNYQISFTDEVTGEEASFISSE